MYKHNDRKVRSAQESRVLAAIPDAAQFYECIRLPYRVEAEYIPDFYVDGVCVELKEYITYAEVAKYEAIARCNTHIKLVFWVVKAEERTLTRLRKTFTVYEGRFTPYELIELLVKAAMTKKNEAEKPTVLININPPVPPPKVVEPEPPAETPSELPSTPIPPGF